MSLLSHVKDAGKAVVDMLKQLFTKFGTQSEGPPDCEDFKEQLEEMMHALKDLYDSYEAEGNYTGMMMTANAMSSTHAMSAAVSKLPNDMPMDLHTLAQNPQIMDIADMTHTKLVEDLAKSELGTMAKGDFENHTPEKLAEINMNIKDTLRLSMPGLDMAMSGMLGKVTASMTRAPESALQEAAIERGEELTPELTPEPKPEREYNSPQMTPRM
ncbi:hypothetical protein [Neptuniibacter sp. QD37_11]|uniref:hypothetical protein n=1 Tax=Neptuniibacter sp. QD37_11 TaxID=3398209 RepID=UPI0039F61B2E